MSFMILPLSLLGNLLRWMSLEGTGGNVLSVLLYLLLVSLPLIYLGINIKKKNLASDMDTKQVIQDGYSSEYIDIDKFYRYKVKGIYGQIIEVQIH